MTARIHPTAIVSAKAKLADDVEIGPYAVIAEDVSIDSKVKIHSHAHILRHTSIGPDCQVHMGAILGHLPQIRQGISEQGRLIIGANNIFREYATVHRSSQENEATVIGADNYFMGFSHIAHDCRIGNHVTICNGTLIAGHVLVEDYAFISGNVTVHQFCRIGSFAMIGGLSRVAKDVPPYMLVKGDSQVWAINTVGLKRSNFSSELRSQIKKAFKLLYKSGLNIQQATDRLSQENNSNEIKHLVDFLRTSKRGICKYKCSTLWERIFLSRSIASCNRLPAYRLFQETQKFRC